MNHVTKCKYLNATYTANDNASVTSRAYQRRLLQIDLIYLFKATLYCRRYTENTQKYTSIGNAKKYKKEKQTNKK